MNYNSKPPRATGLILALALSVGVFSVIPLVVVATLVYLLNRIYISEDGGFAGVSIPGFSTEPLILYTAAALFFLGMAIVAWRGRRPAIRPVFSVLNILYGVVTVIALPGSVQVGMDSASELRASLANFYVLLVIGTVVYVCWFMNRWSARAFYRGYYTPEEKARLAEIFQQRSTDKPLSVQTRQG